MIAELRLRTADVPSRYEAVIDSMIVEDVKGELPMLSGARVPATASKSKRRKRTQTFYPSNTMQTL